MRKEITLANLRKQIVYFIKGTDKVLLFLCMLTSAFGILMVASATRRSLENGGFFTRDVRTMFIAIFIGIIIAFIVSLIDYEIILKVWPVVAGVAILLMIIVFIFGEAPQGGTRSDARTWLNLKVFAFQPSELVKIFFIITFGVHLNKVREKINSIKTISLISLHAVIPVLLVSISGDDGSALIFLLVAICMIFVAGINWKYMLSTSLVLLAAIPILWVNIDDFQKERFLVIINPDLYPATAYQQNMSLSAIGSGGFLGQGLFQGRFTQSGLVPESKNDMIFSVVGEELGLLGCLAALLLLGLVIFKIIRVGKKTGDFAAHYVCYGIASMIAMQTFINIAMCLRIGPVIGITLPFFSAGGSSSLCLYIGIGMIFSIYRSTHDSDPVDFRLMNITSPFM
ncbi:MAG: FtsW/RodA/SpoVE family cell cycle protein [Oscillospiraceae bacterium]|jgi:rod shape determining protein RodA|nr:FtsW/RodA/SpoVE family cell cycle protein [Oscillospiraceae bacterium]